MSKMDEQDFSKVNFSVEENEAILRHLMTASPSPDGKPFFENAAALARYIAGTEGGNYYGRDNTLAATITQIFIAERSIPKDLREAIIGAVHNRLNTIGSSISTDEKRIWLQKTTDALDHVQAIHGRRLRRNAGIPRNMQSATEEAENRFVISPLTSFARKSPTGIELLKIIVRKLGLSTNQQAPIGRYTFCYASQREAIDFWRDLFKIELGQFSSPLGEEPNIAVALEKFRGLDRSGVLRIFELDPYLCLTPGVIYDPGNKNCKGFITLYHASTEKFDIREIPAEYLIQWQQLYWEINMGKLQNNAILHRIWFQDWENYITTESTIVPL